MLPGLIDAGIDCIEHGTGLSDDLVEQMVDADVALVPTVMQLDKFPEYAAAGAARFPTYAATMTELYPGCRATIMAAYDAGWRSTPAPTAAGSVGTATSPARWSPSPDRDAGGDALGAA